MVFNIVTKHGIQAEQIADDVFYIITGYKNEFKKKGINAINNLRVSEERILKQGSDIEFSTVAVSLNYVAKKTVRLSEKQYNLRVYLQKPGEKMKEVFEGIHFKVPPEGTSIIFKDAPPDGSSILIDYIDAITLQEVTGVIPTPVPDGIEVQFYLPNNGTIYGVYKLLSSIIINENNIIGGEWTTVG